MIKCVKCGEELDKSKVCLSCSLDTDEIKLDVRTKSKKNGKKNV